MKGGAVDFLTKLFKDQDLPGIIQEAIQKNVRLQAARAKKSPIQRRIQSLTPREQEVFFLVVKGMMNKEIAFALGASEKTVKVHRGRVMQKMQVQSVAELVRAGERVKPENASPAAKGAIKSG